MTLKEMKLRILSLIEEVNPSANALTDDVDIANKLNYLIDLAQHELARIKRIAAMDKMDVKQYDQVNLYDELKNFYKLKSIEGVKFDVFENILVFNENGTATIKYYKYPKMITSDTKDDDYKFELSDDVLEIMPYKVASDLLIGDVSNQYGKIYLQAYESALNKLDINTTDTIYEIEDDIDV